MRICKKMWCPSVVVFLMGLSISLIGQDRSIDGRDNNIRNKRWGSVNEVQLNAVPVAFGDGISTPAGEYRPNPRAISNAIFEQNGLIMDPTNLSDFAWVWAQFIDHDITLVTEEGESFDIDIPRGDVFFDPMGTGTQKIHFLRSTADRFSGTSTINPRKFPNSITAFIDGSGVYGSDIFRADWLRTFENGKLKSSEGNLLPYNTDTGELDGNIVQAPEMAMNNPFATHWFIAGDIRANENVLLTAMHTIFMREHNRLCDEIIRDHPEWNDEQIYQRARKLVGAMIQSIVYNDWLPSLGVTTRRYVGYQSLVNPGIMNVFSTAAYRYGHTVISGNIMMLDEYGNTMPGGDLSLRDVFFRPDALLAHGGMEPFLRGMAVQVEQDFDTKMIDDLRNFLFGRPGSGGLDLAAMNIQRGRDRGLPDYNTVRESFGLARINSFNEICADWDVNNSFAQIYTDVNDIDPWVGFLAEDKLHYSLFGETVMTIMKKQFENLRDGDRFFYLNDKSLSDEDIEMIERSTLGEIVMRNTGVFGLQENVFVASPLTTSVEEISSQEKYTIFPNPSQGEFDVRIDSKDGAAMEQLVLLDVQGRTIYRADNIYTYEYHVSLAESDVTPGIYFLAIKSDNGSQVQKVIIE